MSKGTYRCFKCNNEERIGRYHTKICPEQSKDRFAKLANSVRIIKRFISRHALKQRAQRLQSFDVPHPGFAELHFDPFYPTAELDATYVDGRAEMSGIGLSELEDFDDLRWMSSGLGMEQILASELSAGNDSLPTPGYYTVPQFAAAELDTSAHSFNTSDIPGLAWTQISPHEHVPDNEYQWPMQEPTTSRSLQLNTSVEYQGQYKAHQVGAASETNHDITVNDGVSPMSPTIHDRTYMDTADSSRDECNSSADDLYPPGLSTGSSSSSTPNNSMSSFDLSNASTESYQPSSSAIFGGYESDLLCSEPEEVDLFPISEASTKAPAINDLFYWHPNPSDLGIHPDTMPSAPLVSKSGHHSAKLPPGALPPSSGRAYRPLALSSHSHPTPFNSKSKYQCECGYEPSGIEANKRSNFKRHQKTAKRHLVETGEYYKCNYPDCVKSYPRRDNLLYHQRTKNHKNTLDFVMSASPSFPESDWEIWEMEGSEVRPLKRRRTDQKFEDGGRDIYGLEAQISLEYVEQSSGPKLKLAVAVDSRQRASGPFVVEH
jgi:hypothetical protein